MKQLNHFKQKAECKDWIERCLKRDLGDLLHLEDALQDGVVLLELINKLSPGAVKSVQKTHDKFKMMQNAVAFLEAIKNYGVDKALFSPGDLVNKKYETVVVCIKELAKVADREGFKVKMHTIDLEQLNISSTETIEKISTEYKLDIDVQHDTETSVKEKTTDVGTKPLSTEDLDQLIKDLETPSNSTEQIELNFCNPPEIRTADFGTTVYIPENHCMIL